MGTAVEDDQPFWRLHDQRLLVRKVVGTAAVVLHHKQLVSLRDLTVIGRAVPQQPDPLGQRIYSADKADPVGKAFQRPFADPVVPENSVFYAEAILPAALPEKKLRVIVAGKKGLHAVRMVIVGMGQDPNIDLRKVYPQQFGVSDELSACARVQ